MLTKVEQKISMDSDCLFPEKEFHCHMPFIFEGNKLLFCRAPLEDRVLETEGTGKTYNYDYLTPYQAWRLYACDWPNIENIIEISKDVPLASISCNPHAYRGEDGEIILTYVSTTTAHRGRFVHKLWQRTGQSFDNLGRSEMIEDTMLIKPYSAFENSEYRIVAHTIARYPFLMMLNKKTGIQKRIAFTQINFLKRVSFLTEDPHLIMLTYHAGRTKWKGVAAYESILWDVEDDVFWEINNNQSELYKCTIFKDQLIYSCEESTLKEVGKNYSMQLKSSRFTLTKSKIKSKVIEETINPYWK